MKKKIMLIDDSVTIHRVIDLCIDKEKYDVVKVFTKEEALSHIKSEKPDLILLDNKLGDTSSQEMIKTLRKTAGNVVIILLAGAFDQFDSNLCMILGADDFLYKPFDAKTLDEKIVNGFSKAVHTDTMDPSEIPTDEELAAAMTDVPQEMEMMLTEEEPEPEELPASVEDVTLPEDLFEEEPAQTEPEVQEDIVMEDLLLEEEPAAEEDTAVEDEPVIIDEPAVVEETMVIEQPAVKEPVQAHPVTDINIPSVADDAFADFTDAVAPSAGAFDGLIEVDEELLIAEEERKKEEARLAAELAASVPETEPVVEEEPEPEMPEEEVKDSFEGLIEVDEEQLLDREAEAEKPVEVPLEKEEELTEDEQENLFSELDEPEGDELDNILDGINEEHEHQHEEVAHADETINNAEEALDDTVETVLTDIQAELSLSDVMEEQVQEPDSTEPEILNVPEPEPDPYVPQQPEVSRTPDVKDIDPEPMVRISEEKLVEAVYEAIDEDTLKFAVKEVLTDKITRILEEELPVLVERAIRKEIERLVKGK